LGKKNVILSRPCLYGVFSGPIGGFAPRPKFCVGCLRCTTQYPEMVQVLRNYNRQKFFGSSFSQEMVDSLLFEAQSGKIPVKGAGYKGEFGGRGWDSMWFDMSEIVRPTRDGIHGREFISTVVDIGEKPSYLQFDDMGKLKSLNLNVFSIQIPFIFDIPPPIKNKNKLLSLLNILSQTAKEIETILILPIDLIEKFSLEGKQIVPLFYKNQKKLHILKYDPLMLEINGYDEEFYKEIKKIYPKSIICARLNFDNGYKEKLIESIKFGIRTFHLVANYYGKGRNGKFIMDLIKEAHKIFVEASIRDEVTLIGSGGFISAEHVPKGIICGLDAVALDIVLLMSLQGKFINKTQFLLPSKLNFLWGVQRLKNLIGSWRDQLLEVLGAMGLREVRRLRGEVGRAIFQKELEEEAFGDIYGYNK